MQLHIIVITINSNILNHFVIKAEMISHLID